MSLILRRDKGEDLTMDELDDNLEYLEQDGGGGGVKSLHYIAALEQSGTDDPVPTVIRNDFDGEPVWRHLDVGAFTGTLAGIGVGQVRVILPIDTWSSPQDVYTGGVNDDDSIYLNTSKYDGTGGFTKQDGLLYGAGYSYIEIIKYL